MSDRGPDVWLEEVLKCQYLPENDMKILCEKVKELLMEGEWRAPLQGQRAGLTASRVEYPAGAVACDGVRVSIVRVWYVESRANQDQR